MARSAESGRWPKWCDEHKIEARLAAKRRYARKAYAAGVRDLGRDYECAVDGCTSRGSARGLCKTHYNQVHHSVTRSSEYRRAHENIAARQESLRSRTRRRHQLERAADADAITLAELGERDAWSCGICGEPVDQELNCPDRAAATVDHVMPISRGGRHVWDNVQLAHFGCNMAKGATLVA